MQGKVCLVTGANAGIGKATALGLAEMGARVVMVARDRARGEAAQAEIKQKSGNEAVDLLLADLSSQEQIRHLAAEFKRRFPSLHVLINNAGIVPLQRQETVDGLEMQLAVNHLAYFMLTILLLDVLKASAPARIINVSSQVHAWGRIDLADLQSKKGYDPREAYAQAKLANVLFTYELGRRLAGSGVTANCLHPGVVATELSANYAGRLQSGDAPLADSARGAQTPIYLATSSEVEGVSGHYFVSKTPTRSSAASYDETLARQLWQVSEELVRT
jgi:NAD(P)-dependent dehydrogenase (short-subunit alcohol dehydrogenase family)